MKAKHVSLFAAAPALLATWLMAALISPTFTCQGQTAQNLGATMAPAPPPGEIWVYPQGVFPDDFYSLWLAVNGTPYTSGDLPYPFYSIPDNQPGERPVFVGKSLPDDNWTVVLKARRLEHVGDGSYREGAFTAFNLGLAAGTKIIKGDPVPPVNYLLTTGGNRFSTGFGELLLQRSVKIRGEITPNGEERFFGYTPNFDPQVNPDTNPKFKEEWLPQSYLCGSEYEPGTGYGVRSTKSVIYGGHAAIHIRPFNVDLSVRNCLLYGQLGQVIRVNSGPCRTLIQNVQIRHTYHKPDPSLGNTIGMFTQAIQIWPQIGRGGKHRIKGCLIDQSPTWQEYYFEANYKVSPARGGHGISITLSKDSPDDFVQVEDSTIRNCGRHCVAYDTSNVDLRIANCTIDGGYFPIRRRGYFDLDWTGNCMLIDSPSVDQWNRSPVIEILRNTLFARGSLAYGAWLYGCSNGEVTFAKNTITSESASYVRSAGGVLLQPIYGAGSNRNTISENTIQGWGEWAIAISGEPLWYGIDDTPCKQNAFINNKLGCFSPEQGAAVFFGPVAVDNYFHGDLGAGIVDLGTGNVVEP